MEKRAADDEEADVSPETSTPIPPEREGNLQRKEGFSYQLVTINFVKGTRFGLGIKHHMNLVIVTKVEEGSMTSDCLKVCDQICDVNGMPVTDKDVCKTALIKSLQKNRTVNMIIARPVNDAAQRSMNSALNASMMQPPSIAVAADVRSIMRRFDQKLHHQPAKPGIMHTGAAPAPHEKVRFDEANSHRSMMIKTDHDLEKLKKVPKKAPPPPPPKQPSVQTAVEK